MIREILTKMSCVIIGAGIAGLYAAYKLKDYPGDVHIFEASDRIGGRIYEIEFHGYKAPMGASMIRLTDTSMIRLCRELGLELKLIDATLESKETKFINDMIERIIKKYDPKLPLDVSVLEYLRQNFTSEEVEKYIDHSIYRDYLDSSIHEYLFHYPITDHLQEPMQGFVVKGGYSRLIDALYNQVKEFATIHLQEPIVKVTPQYIVTAEGKRKKYDLLYWTVTQENKHIIQNLLPETTKVMNNIYGVPFLTMYAHVDSATKYPEMVVGGLLGKMYPLGKNVLMVGYTDHVYAEHLYKNLQGFSEKNQLIDYVQGLVRQNAGFEDVVIKDLIYKYWPVGIHQNLKYVETNRQRYGKVFLIGESISQNQGWAEGAVSMVDKVV
jgi:hypothetical protein